MKRDSPEISPVERLSDRRTELAKVITYSCPIYPQGGSRSMPSRHADAVRNQACHPQEVERKGDCPADPDPSAGTAGDSRARETVVMQDEVMKIDNCRTEDLPTEFAFLRFQKSGYLF
ncbi:unnamed protein product [Musa acuminata subsp. burmannicoides]